MNTPVFTRPSQITLVAEAIYRAPFVTLLNTLDHHPHAVAYIFSETALDQFVVGRDGERLYIAKTGTLGATEDETATAIFEAAYGRIVEQAAADLEVAA